MILRVILLNGASSSGKSTLAIALKEKLNWEFDIVSIDEFLKMSADEVIYEDDVFDINPLICKRAVETLKSGHGVIIDHVITSERIYRQLREELEGYEFIKVKAECPLSELEKRERDRGDRCKGSAKASYEYLYPKDGYDVTVDTLNLTAEECAERIWGLLG